MGVKGRCREPSENATATEQGKPKLACTTVAARVLVNWLDPGWDPMMGGPCMWVREKGGVTGNFKVTSAGFGG